MTTPDEEAKKAALAGEAQHKTLRDVYDNAAAAVFEVVKVTVVPREVAQLAKLLGTAPGDYEALAVGRRLLDITHDAAQARVPWMTTDLHWRLYALNQAWLDLERSGRG